MIELIPEIRRINDLLEGIDLPTVPEVEGISPQKSQKVKSVAVHAQNAPTAASEREGIENDCGE